MPGLFGSHRETPQGILMIRGVIATVVAGAILALMLAYSAGSFSEKVPASVVMEDGGGAIQAGSDVKLRGVIVGKVKSVNTGPHDTGVRLDLELEPDQARKVPGNVTVRVLPVSIFGAAYVELVRPRAPRGEITAGAVLTPDASRTTVELQHLLDDTEDLVDALGPADLATMLNTFATALDGQGEVIGAMIDDADHVMAEVEPYVPLIRQDLRLATVVMTTFSRMAPNLFTALDGLMMAGQTMIDTEKQFTSFTTKTGAVLDGANQLISRYQAALEYGVPLIGRVVNALYLGRGDLPRVFAAVVALADRVGPAITPRGWVRIDGNLRTTKEDGYGPGDCPSYGGLNGRGCPGGGQ
ncbi:MAG TPA: MCE family protein [Nocardioides sp.]